MTTYYVRKSGSNSNAGTSPSTAWLTLAKVLASGSSVAAGDTVYVGAGTYRESNISIAIAGSSGNMINIIGDVDGVQTGDPGDVVMSAWLTNDSTSPDTNALLTYGAHSYLHFWNVDFLGASLNNQGQCVAAGAVHYVQFTNCVFCGVQSGGSNPVVQIYTYPDVNSAILFDKCFFLGGAGVNLLTIFYYKSSVADYDTGWIIRNCILFSLAGGQTIILDNASSGSYYGGGGKILQSTFIGGGQPIFNTNNPLDSTQPLIMLGNRFFGTGGPFTCINMSTVEDYNFGDTAARGSGAPAGPNTIGFSHQYAPTMELWQSFLTGRQQRPFFSPGANAPELGLIPLGLNLVAGIPTSTTDDATVGTVSWTNPTFAQRVDGAYAVSGLTASQVGHYLLVTGLGFALPSTATVTQIHVSYLVDYTSSGVAAVNSLKLIKGGTIGGTDKASSAPVLQNNSQTYQAVGAANDLWGQTWLYSDINASNFGVAISFKETSGSGAVNIRLDYIRVEVEYTDTVIPPEQQVDFAGVNRPSGGVIKIAAGAFERSNIAIRETSTVHTGSNAIKIAGPGVHDFSLAVDAVSTVVSAYMRYDASYGGSVLPSMQVIHGTECGVANATVSQVGADNTWEQVSLTIVPTAKGVVTIRFSNLSNATAGNVYVDTFAVT